MEFTPEQVENLAGYFSGTWRFTRQITDNQNGQNASVEGTAIFSGDEKTLKYAETGTMNYGAYQGVVTQNYIYDFTGPFEADVLFSDHRLFHKLNLKTGQTIVAHWCSPDQYDGCYFLRDQANWTLSWKIAGPKKNSIISTSYHRLVS